MNLFITGIGIVSPYGIGKDAFLSGVTTGKSALSDLTLFEPPGNCEHAGEVPDGFDWKEFIFSKQSYADRMTQLAAGAARLALNDAKVGLPVEEDATEIGLCFGSKWGCLGSVAKFYEPVAAGKGRSASGLVFSHSYPNSPTSFVAIEFGLRGYSTSFTGSAEAGVWALDSGVNALTTNTCDKILVGAADALDERIFTHMEHKNELPDTTSGNLQTNKENSAKIPSEAAVFLLLETTKGATNKSGENSLPLTKELLATTKKAHEFTHLLGDAGAAGPLLNLAFFAVKCAKQ